MNSTIHVLIVDDNKYLADIMGSALSIQPDIYVTDVCHSGVKALEVLRNTPVDIMLLDIIMPDMDGLQVLSLMNMNEVKKPGTILLTAIGSDDILERAAALGADSFLTKPVNADVIVQKIRAVYHDRQKLTQS